MAFVVYAMRHQPTGRFYIGSTNDLERRRYQWAGHFARLAAWVGGGDWRAGSGISKRMFETSVVFEDYEFLILDTLPENASADDAARMENRAITWAATLTPTLLLNSSANT